MQITIKKPTDAEITHMKKHPTWGCDISTFDWHYDDEETFLLIEGAVTIEYAKGSVRVTPGDLVTCPAGLSCVWNVTSPVRKHYVFS